MASLAMFSSIFCSIFLVFHIEAEINHKDVKIQSYCKGTFGLKDVDIIWKPLFQKNSSSLAKYRISYHPMVQGSSERYRFGCMLNMTQHQSQKELQCRMTEESLFPIQFYYIVELRNSSGVYLSHRLSCRLLSKVRCTRPQNLTAKATGKRSISLSWKPAPFMGKYILCYKLWYAAAHENFNESVQMALGGESRIIDDLSPYTEYKFYIQCSLGCQRGWGLLDGPVTVQTLEDVPTQAPQFNNWSASNTHKEKRDVTVVWQLPPLNTWNGVPNKFNIDYWQTAKQNDSSAPIPNSTKSLQINDSSATEATIRGLNRYVAYQTQISMCTAEGCGPKSVPWLLEGEEAKENESYVDNRSLDSPHIWTVLAVVIGLMLLFCFIMAAICFFRESRVRRRQPPLQERMQLDPPYSELENSALPARSSDYERLYIYEDPTDPQLINQDSDDSNVRTLVRADLHSSTLSHSTS